jgi:hypothetical protein
MLRNALIFSIFPTMSFACSATDEEIRAMYGFVGFATFAGIALVATVVLGVRALRKPKP